MNNNKLKRGSALTFTIILLIFVSGVSLTISLLMYQTVKITSNDIERKQGKLIATNYAYNTYYDDVFELNGYTEPTYSISTETVDAVTTTTISKDEEIIIIKTVEDGVTTINYVTKDVIVSRYSDNVNTIVTSTFKNKYIIKLTIDDSHNVIKLEEGE